MIYILRKHPLEQLKGQWRYPHQLVNETTAYIPRPNALAGAVRPLGNKAYTEDRQGPMCPFEVSRAAIVLPPIVGTLTFRVNKPARDYIDIGNLIQVVFALRNDALFTCGRTAMLDCQIEFIKRK